MNGGDHRRYAAPGPIKVLPEEVPDTAILASSGLLAVQQPRWVVNFSLREHTNTGVSTKPGAVQPVRPFYAVQLEFRVGR